MIQVHPFEGRDPRFYVSILYHGAQWQGRAVDVSPTGLDNINIGGVPRVNYFTRKYLWEQHNLTTGSGEFVSKICNYSIGRALS